MSNQKTNNEKTKVVTGKGRLSFAYIWEPKEQKDGSFKYSTSFLVPKTDTKTYQRLRDAVNAAYATGLREKWGGKKPDNLKLPLRDGDKEAEKKGDPYRGHWFFNASSKFKPGICDKNLNEILEQSEVYSGCYACICVEFYPYDVNGGTGISCYLQHVQKVGDGEPFSNIEKASDVFTAFEDDTSGAAASDEVFHDLFDEDGDLPFGEDDPVQVA